MSFKTGTLASDSVSAVSRLAQRMGKAAFFAPDTVISPFRRRPPVIRSLSIRLRLVLGGGQRTHGQCVDFGFHAFAQCGVDPLVAGNQAQALEFGADDSGFEVRAVARDVKVVRSEEHTSELQSLMRISYA